MKRYMVLTAFMLLTLIGLVLFYGFGSKSRVWSFWSALDVSFAVALGMLAFVAYRNMIRDEDEVRLYFDTGKQQVDTGLCLLRKDCTRGEIIGVLGMMQRKTDRRFHYDAVHLHDLLNEINKVQKGSQKKLFIPLDEVEFEQFVLGVENG